MRKLGSRMEIDMINGPILGKIMVFSIQLIITGVLQLLFNAADVVVVGKYAGSNSLAAVGSTSALINLMVNLFMGVSVGASVVMGKYVGARQYDEASDTLKTAMSFALLSGMVLVAVGYFFSSPLLTWMGTPSEVLTLAVRYMRWYFLGMPAFMVYNFGAAILRSIGDTKRPLYFLSISGVVNVILNLILVIVFKLGVVGVAVATVVAQYISAILIVLSFTRSTDYLHLDLRDLNLNVRKVAEMLKIGIPAGLQGAIFSISNVLIQSSVNSFGNLAMAGNTAAANLEGFIYVSMNAIYQACMTFTSQNMGAKRYERIGKILRTCLMVVFCVGFSLGALTYLAAAPLLSIYTNDPQVVAYGVLRLGIIVLPYFFCGFMDTLCGSMRGMGNSFIPMCVSLFGACVLRIVWVFTIFAWVGTLESLYISYPVTWAFTALLHTICYFWYRQKEIVPFLKEAKERARERERLEAAGVKPE